MKSVQQGLSKRQYQCCYCGAMNEFDARINANAHITFEGGRNKSRGEPAKHSPTVYVLKCIRCKQANRVQV